MSNPGDSGFRRVPLTTSLIAALATGASAQSAPGTDLTLQPGELRFAAQPSDRAQEPSSQSASPAAPAPGSGASDSAELAKKLSNPVASLISVPLQFNYDEGYGPKDAERMTLNIQPVIPLSISEDWNLIIRTIIPVIYQGSVAEGLDSEFGIGDTVQSFFFSPKEPVRGWILAAGPVALWPTGTDPQLRSEQLGFGPTALALRQSHGWTYGMLVNHLWGVTESDDHPDVNATFLQPFVSYTWPTATTLTLNTESTYDWASEQWNVPINLMAGQLVKFRNQPVQFTIGGRYYADSPDGGPEWGLRFVVTFLFPK